MSDVGSRIAQARRDVPMTQEQLAERIGKAPGSISAYECGRITPRWKALQSIAATLGRPVEWFVGDDDTTLLEAEARDATARVLGPAIEAAWGADTITASNEECAPVEIEGREWRLPDEQMAVFRQMLEGVRQQREVLAQILAELREERNDRRRREERK